MARTGKYLFICFVKMSVSKVRKKRTQCNEYQISELKKAFLINPKASFCNLQPLARRLGIRIDVAKHWFYKWQVQCGLNMEGSERSKHINDMWEWTPFFAPLLC